MEHTVRSSIIRADHINISKGIGLILCTATTNKLRDKEIVLLKGLNILLEPTIFGTAISGKVPETLRGNVETVCNYNIIPRIVSKGREPLFKIEEEEEGKLKEELQFLSDQEYLGISNKEVHGDNKIAWEHLIRTTKRINNKEFEVRMPFNDKIHLLKSNIRKAAGRGIEPEVNKQR